ncbi:benzoate membrane transport protein [Nakamurella panacisegetis]|uniref:Benzoate membrane transport protein n=1 Tax=Nakamurella panacisegetis TaxID=1090615 RepID=A0A1H0T634_9ACTN|nr:benzoate/H(+) symporter BenE family transporter [Nakamurella panacisegetis]SDP48946.1 benzoate membrane transport protein [Nakamurella panacisegetis]
MTHTSVTAKRPTADTGVGPAVVAGVVTAVVGFTSSFAVVLAGLRAVGADTDQAASGLLVLCVSMGAGSIFFSWRLKIPMTMAWSTPGAALLAGSAMPADGFAAAVPAFALAGALIALCGLIRPLGRAVAAIPPALANAMLAGVLLTLCVEPFRALSASPAAIAPVVLTWLVLTRVARRWAVPGALGVAVVVMAVTGSFSHLAGARLAPVVVAVSPSWEPATVVAIALPLFLVTMTSQNIPGMAVLASFGYRPRLAPPLLYTGGATVVGAFAGAHAINLAAISAALAAGPTAHPDPERRWVAGVTCGAVYLVLGPASALVAAVAQAAPAGIMAAIAGLALIGTFASAAGSALADGGHREAAAVTFLVAASGVAFGGIGAAFWGLLAGSVYLLVMRRPLWPPR